MSLDLDRSPHSYDQPRRHGPYWRPGAACGLLLLAAGCQLEVEPEGSTAGLHSSSQPSAAAGSAAMVPVAGSGAVAVADPPTAAQMPAAQTSAQTSAVMTASAAQAGSAAPAPAAAPAAHDPAPKPSASAGAPAPQPPVMATAPAAAPAARPAAPGCVPGNYVGTISGSLQLAQFASLSSVSGTIRAELAQDDAQGLVLKNAHVVAVDQDQNAINATLTGRLNCTTHQLENGKLDAGSYHMKTLSTDAAFSGDATAMQVQDPPSVVGTWQATVDNLLFLGGKGTWNLVLDTK